MIENQNLSQLNLNHNPLIDGEIEFYQSTNSAQKEIWASITLSEEVSLCYNECLMLDWTTAFDINILQKAFIELITKHPSLRSTFTPDGSIQMFHQLSPLNKKYYNIEVLNTDSISQYEEKLKNLKKNHVTTPFKLTTHSPIRLTALAFKHSFTKLIISFHHIVCDGESSNNLITDLMDIYTQIQKNKYVKKPSLKISKFDAASESALKYWKNEISQIKTENCTQYLKSNNRPQFRSFSSTRYDLSLDQIQSHKIFTLAKKHHMSLFSYVLTHVQITLAQLNQEESITLGVFKSPQSNEQNLNEISHKITLLPLSCSIQSGKTYFENIKSLDQKLTDILDAPSITFGEIIPLIEKRNIDTRVTPLFSIVFNIDRKSNISPLLKSVETVPRAYENFEIFINMKISESNQIVFETQYNTQIFTSSEVELLISGIVKNLQIENTQNTICHVSKSALVQKEPSSVKYEKNKYTIQNRHIEEKVLSLWESTLKTKVNLDSNFFASGGHSILALELARTLQNTFKTSFTVKDAFLNPTPLQQIIYLEKHAKDVFPQNENSRQVGQSISFNEESQDLSIAQQQILFLEKSQNVGALHNLPAAIKITGDLDLNRLGSALSILIHKYEALRTYFKSENKKIVRKVSNTHTPASLEIEKIKGTLEEVSALLAESARENFDLIKWPLMKVKFFETHCGQKILFFNFHHIIWDGWCFDLFFEELNKYYVTQDFDHTLEDQKNLSSYSNYVLKQQRYLKSDKGTNDKKYWKTILSHPSNKLQLPYLPTNNNNNADVSSSFSLNFNRKNYHSIINQYAQKYSTTVYSVLLACFKITLAKYSQNNDITVGVPVQNRNTPELKYTLGYFVNTLPIRSHIDLDLSFNENLKLIQTQCLDAYEHQELPFFEIQRLVDEDSRNHFLSGLFSFQDVSDRQGVFNNLPYSQINLNNASSHTNLDLWIKFSKNNIEGAFQFKNKIFSESFIHEFSDLYLHIIESCLSNPDKAIRSLSVSPKQREKLRQWGNGPDIRQNKTVLEMFTSELNKNPNKIAVSCNSHSMTYSELNDVSDKIAFNLKLTKNSPDTKVGVCIERSSYLSCVILAIFKCGYIYVPLDHTFPSERLNYILSDSKLDILITEKSLHLSPKTKNTLTVYLNDLVNIKKDESSNYKTLGKTDLNENSIAYILYTSGTTGTPKGVLISHKSLQNFARSMQDYKIINEYDKILAHTTICFDISILEILIPILSGASLHIADKTDVMAPNLLNTLIKKYSINMIQATPSTWKLLMSQQWKSQNSNLKILTGGERVSQEVIDYLNDFSKNIYNMYGPTETTIWSSFQKISPKSRISAGKPIHNTQFIILGKNNEVLPPNALGELFIGGLGLSNGYHNKPDLSALKFKIVTTDVMSGVFYSTGDLAQWNESGEIEILGRNDSQIKINGYRLELFEIDSCLRKLNLFTDTHIFIINKEDSPKIAAAVCLKSGKLSEEQDIKKYLSQYLPYYMIPQHFIFLDEIPKTASQKIDENALNFLLKNELESKYISVKENTLNEKIRKIWKSYLNIENINDSDNFFELGGHSLIALEMNTQLEEELNLKIPLKLLIEASDFSEFSKKVSDLKINPSTENESLVIIKNGLTKKNSLFCFHAVGGSVLNYAVLSSSLPTEQYLVGFQSRALDGITPVKSSIEDMARDYVSELLNFQPEGPFTLCGGSMGGMIAYEVAQQLIAKGHQIKKLILFDTFGPEINLLDFDTPLEKLKSIVRPLFKNKVENPYSHLLVNQITHQNYNALLKYRPKEYKGDIHLLRGKRTLFGIYKDKYMGWRSTVKGDILIDYIHAPHDYFIEHADFKAAFEKIIKDE